MNNKTIKNVGIILGCSIAAKVLSYFWEALIAAYLGASDQADALYMVTSIFGILYPILDLGIWKVFLPIYKTKLVEDNESKAERIANVAVTLFFTLSAALVLFLLVCAKPLVSIIAPGFDAEKQSMTVQYLRISAPTYLLMAVASVVGAMLQSREKFLGSQIREIGTHVSKIIFIFICFRFLGIYAAVIAMIVGSIFRLLVQLPFINWKWKFRPDFHFGDEDVVPMLKGLPSVAVTAAIAHINGLVDRTIASGAASGSVACLNYGHKLVNVFSGMVSTAISTAVYPTMIQYIAEKKTDKLNTLLTKVITALGFIIIPLSCFCALFSKELVTVAFQRGAFDAAATELTAGVFMGYCIGMLFVGVSTVVTNVFYGFGDTKLTMYISIVQIVLNVGMNLLLIRVWGVAGLAYATSAAAIICLCIRLFFLKKYLKVDYRAIIKENLKILGLSLVSCAIPFVAMRYLLHLNPYLTLIISVCAAAGVYFVLAYICRIDTLHFLKDMVMKRLGKGKANEEEDIEKNDGTDNTDHR